MYGSEPGNKEPTGVVTLDASLDSHAAEELWGILRQRVLTDLPLAIAGDQVERVTTPCLQVLVAVAHAAQARQQPFTLTSPSPVLAEAIEMLGLQDVLRTKGAA